MFCPSVAQRVGTVTLRCSALGSARARGMLEPGMLELAGRLESPPVVVPPTGCRTRSIRWTTALSVTTSAHTTFAAPPLIWVPPSGAAVNVSSPPSVSTRPSRNSSATVSDWPATMWTRSTDSSRNSSASKALKTVSGMASNASFVGAKTVNGPSPASWSASSVASRAAVIVLSSSVIDAMSLH